MNEANEMNRKKKMKNVILILSDQHRFCDVGYRGNRTVETPTLDQMAAEGADFDRAYSPCPLCVPARGSIFTGLHALKHGAAANDLPVDPKSPSLAKSFRAAGYDTAYIGKWHLGGVPREKFIPEEERLGFDEWMGCNCNHEYLQAYYDDNANVRHPIEGYEPETQTDLALEYLKREREHPFLLALSFGPPHDPYFALPDGEKERFEQKEIEIRPNALHQEAQDFPVQHMDIRENYAGYFAQISQLDRQISRIIDYLKDSGKSQDTIVVYTSDHGDMLGSHGFANKQLWYEESARIPCIFWSPGLIPAGRRSQLFSLVDLYATLCGLCQIPAEPTDGYSLAPAILDPAAPGQPFVYFYSYVPCHQASFRKVDSWRAVTDGRYKLVVDSTGKTVACYDCQEDLLEFHNLDDPERIPQVRTLREMLQKSVEEHDGFLFWEDLLFEAGLMDAWITSERYFTKAWASFMPPEAQKLRMKGLDQMEEKYRRKHKTGLRFK